MEDRVVDRRARGVVEEEVVLDAHAGEDGHGDLNVAAFVGGGKEIEGGEAEARSGSGQRWRGRVGRWVAVAWLRYPLSRADPDDGAPGAVSGSACGDEAEERQQGECVAAHDGGGSVCEPEQSDGDGDAGDGDAVAEDGVEQEGNPGGGEEFGVGGALVRGEEHVGVDDVEGRGEQGCGGRGEGPGEMVEREARGGEGEPGVARASTSRA